LTEVKELLKRVKDLEIKTKGFAEGIASGSYKSKIRGRGIEFSQVREYVFGDDTRNIDWNVTARYNKLFVKEFVEERDLFVYVIYDNSASNDFGYKKSKKDFGLEIAASLIFSAMKNNDNIGLGIFTDKLEVFVPAKKGKRHSLQLIRELLINKPKSKKTDIQASLTNFHKIIKQRSTIFIISDFISESFTKPLKYLKNKHDVILVKLSDTTEKKFPEIGYALVEDSETGEQIIVNTSDKDFQMQYKQFIIENDENLKRESQKLNIDMIEVTSDKPFDKVFNSFFEKRMFRR
tara:strand:- start:1593 stop:2468 length:876 start_codon:yes stop_codon:yes gene_type:complete